MTRSQYILAINAASLEGFHFLASVLLIWYERDFPADFAASRLRTLTNATPPPDHAPVGEHPIATPRLPSW